MDTNAIFGEGDIRNMLPRYTQDAREANQVLVDLLNAIEAKKNATSAQITLAWILSGKPWIVPIPGTTKLHRLTENNGAEYLELTADDLGEIETAYSQIQIVGTRYTEAMEKSRGLWVEKKSNWLHAGLFIEQFL